ncbi:DNA-binding protein [Pseudomonas fluorescens]|nr:DNA-binding protein [Pseudomonas fluorescens]
MARIRTIKPEFWSSEQVMESRPLARLLFIGLWNFCDDGGNHPLAPRTIKALVFPGDDITTEAVSELLGELEGSGLTRSYTVDGKLYLHVNGWKHQKIEKRTFKYPKPPQLIVEDNVDDEENGPIDQQEVVEQTSSGGGVIVEESSTSGRVLAPGRDVDVDVEGKGMDQHHSLNAGEEIPGSSFEGFDDLEDLPPEDAEQPVDPKAPVEMTLDWMPDANLLKTYCVHFGVSTDLFTKEAVAPFTAHHETAGTLNTQSKWVSLLVKWVNDDKNRASNIRPFPKPQAIARHTLTGSRDYKAGTKENANGTFRL